jgi:hypothetical protein
LRQGALSQDFGEKTLAERSILARKASQRNAWMVETPYLLIKVSMVRSHPGSPPPSERGVSLNPRALAQGIGVKHPKFLDEMRESCERSGPYFYGKLK